MKLHRYLQLTGIDDEAFASSIDMSVSGLRKLKSGERIPRPHTMRRIYEATGGEVTANDFYEDLIPTRSTSQQQAVS
ncbi:MULTISPECIES: helix-turn-helix transcriptional regulator [Brucella/Ochrobactrum group]|uniref:HTH cro/C1-type domain-containing protein n=1 Tax=Ochrobactrum soli TaxID=2448455 RepID=A0A2P9HK09_9HYPH|nr:MULTISPECIES: helix-turn-helix transcriptional regulator [Brucella/Ochrobactrum group]SPL64437.1 hypothetical protein OHAE_304 [[Ochrobactrum] soli]